MNSQGESESLGRGNIWGGAGILSGFTVLGVATFMGKVLFDGLVIFNNIVTFTQDVIFDAPVIMHSDLTVEGDVVVGGLEVEDLVVLNTAIVGGVTTLNDVLHVYPSHPDTDKYFRVNTTGISSIIASFEFKVPVGDPVTSHNVLMLNDLKLSVEAPLIELLGDVDVVGGLDVEGDVNVVGPVSVEGAMGVVGDVEIAGHVDVVGNVDIAGVVGVVGDVGIAGNVDIVGNVDILGAVVIVGATEVLGDLNATGLLSGEGSCEIIGSGKFFSITSLSSITLSPSDAIDPGIGSGATLVMKNNLGRSCIFRSVDSAASPETNKFEIEHPEIHFKGSGSVKIEHDEGLDVSHNIAANGLMRCKYYYKHNADTEINVGGDDVGGTCNVNMKGLTSWIGGTYKPTWNTDPVDDNDLCRKAYVDSLHSTGTLQTAYNHGTGEIVLGSVKPVTLTQYGSDLSLLVFKNSSNVTQMIIQNGGLNFPSLGVPMTTTYQELAYVNGVTSSIQTQLNARLQLSGGTMTGNITTGALICGASSAEIGYLAGVTTSIQTQLNNRLLLSGGDLTGPLTSSSTICGASSTEIGYLIGVTSGIQTQINNRLQLAGGAVTGLVTFNTTVPTTSITSFTSVSQFVTRGYVDNHPGTNILDSDNTWTGQNTFTNTTLTLKVGADEQDSIIYFGGDVVTNGVSKTNTIRMGGKSYGTLTATVTNHCHIGGNAHRTSVASTANLNTINNIYIGGDSINAVSEIATGTQKVTNIIKIGGMAKGPYDLADCLIHTEIILGAHGDDRDSLFLNELTFGSDKTFAGYEHVFTPYTNFGTLVAGVFILINNAGPGGMIPLPYTIAAYSNITNQQYTSGTVGFQAQSGANVGSWQMININDRDAYYYVRPDFGVIVWTNTNFSGTVRLNFKNTYRHPVIVRPDQESEGSSCKIYYKDREQLDDLEL